VGAEPGLPVPPGRALRGGKAFCDSQAGCYTRVFARLARTAFRTVGVAQGQSAGLWLRMLGVRIPSPTPIHQKFRKVALSRVWGRSIPYTRTSEPLRTSERWKLSPSFSAMRIDATFSGWIMLMM
jgi:hypothetical protein